MRFSANVPTSPSVTRISQLQSLDNTAIYVDAYLRVQIIRGNLDRRPIPDIPPFPGRSWRATALKLVSFDSIIVAINFSS